jgi:Tfp pilus assembly protein PilF
MRERRHESANEYAWMVWGAATLIVGALAGYLLAPGGALPSAASSPAASAPAGSTTLDTAALSAYRNILERDPANLQAAISAANLLYDAQRYDEAVPLYQRAFALDPGDINISTDLGTALWYSGRPDEALAQYEKSLAIDATHAPTLFNVGVVRADGKHDQVGARAAWSKLLETNPTYKGAAMVRARLAEP